MYALALLQGMVFYMPIATLYRQAQGLTLGEIAAIEGVSWLFSLAMELPWGLLADRIGYRRTMVCCCGLFFLSKVIFWQAGSFCAFLLERFVLSAAIAGLSGVDSSILYLSCAEGESQRVFGRQSAFGTAGALLSTLVYAVFIGENYRLAALATVASYGLAALLSLGLVEVRGPERDRPQTVRAFFALLRETLRGGRFLLFLLAYALYRETMQMVLVWLNQPQYLRCGMSAAAIGWAYIAVTVAALASAGSKRMTDRFGAARFAVSAFLLAGAGCATLLATRSAALSFACIAGMTMADSLLAPLAGRLINDQITARDRATQLSIYAFLQDLVAAGADFVYGRAADVSLDWAFLLAALACALGCAAFWIWYRRRA